GLHEIHDVVIEMVALRRAHQPDLCAHYLLAHVKLIDGPLASQPLDIFAPAVIQGLAGAHRCAHGFLADARAIEAHIALHHLINRSYVMRDAEGTSQDAIRTTDASRLDRAVHNAVFGLLDRICRTDLRAGGIFAVHAHDGTGLRRYRAIHELEMNH